MDFISILPLVLFAGSGSGGGLGGGDRGWGSRGLVTGGGGGDRIHGLGPGGPLGHELEAGARGEGEKADQTDRQEAPGKGAFLIHVRNSFVLIETGFTGAS
jgi:hypothetical protein